MKKEELKKILNKAPDSICLHDSVLEKFCWLNNNLTLTIALGGFHYLINKLEEYVDNIENHLIIILKFYNLREIKLESYGEVRFNDCEIMENIDTDGVYKLRVLDCGDMATFEFQYDNYEWDIIEELDSNAYYKDHCIKIREE